MSVVLLQYSRYFAGLAILIACLDLFGLTPFLLKADTLCPFSYTYFRLSFSKSPLNLLLRRFSSLARPLLYIYTTNQLR